MCDRENMLAHRLADEAARSDIECYCCLIMSSKDKDKSHWYDVSCPAPYREAEHARYVPMAIEYLALKGKIERNAIHPNRVRILIDENQETSPF
jgi:hypothetical protein